MRKAFTGLSILLLLLVVVQFFFAASGAFGIRPDNDAYRPHHVLGYVIFSVPVVMAIIAGLARLPRRLVGMSALIAGLVSVQVAIGALSRALGDGAAAGPYIFGLHGVIGLSILGTAWRIVAQARALPKSADVEPLEAETAS